MASDGLIDVLIGGIGGAAGAGAQLAADEVSMLRKLSLAQLAEQRGGKGNLREIDAKAIAGVNWLHQNELIGDEERDRAAESTDYALTLVNHPQFAGALEAAGEASTETARSALRVPERRAINTVLEEEYEANNMGSEHTSAAQSAYATLAANGQLPNQLEGVDPTTKRGAATILNDPAVKATLSTIETSIGQSQDRSFQLSEAAGERSGAEESVRLDTLAERGWRDQNFADDPVTFLEVRDEFLDSAVDDSNEVFKNDLNSIGSAGRAVYSRYAAERHRELLEQDIPENKIKSIIAQEGQVFRNMDPTELFGDMAVERADRDAPHADFDRRLIEDKVQRLRTLVDLPPVPEGGGIRGSGSESPDPSPSPDPGAGTGTGSGIEVPDPSTGEGAGVQQPGAGQRQGEGMAPEPPPFLQQRGPQGPQARVTDEGGVELGFRAGGSKEEIIGTARRLLARSFTEEGSDDDMRRARELIAQNTTPADRNGVSVERYLNDLLREMILEARGSR